MNRPETALVIRHAGSQQAFERVERLRVERDKTIPPQGKDHLTALYALWLAVTKPGAIVVCVSPSQRQSDLWAERLTSFALSKREIRASIADLSESGCRLVRGPVSLATLRACSTAPRAASLWVNKASGFTIWPLSAGKSTASLR